MFLPRRAVPLFLLSQIASPLLFVLLASACSAPPRPPVTDEAAAEHRAWHAGRIERLKAEDGWLTLIGLDWLEPGEHTLGCSPSAEVALPAGLCAPAAATLLVEDGEVTLRPASGSGLTIDGEPATERRLATDAEGKPTVVAAGRVRFHVIDREGRLGVRIKDPQSVVRQQFEGIETFPFDPGWRIVARWVAFDEPRTISVVNVVGQVSKITVPGEARFDLRGEALSLIPLTEHPLDEELFFVFGDATNGESTYHAGRFLDAQPVKDGTVILDFNRAYNPPCAFTPYATCALPPEGNRLDIAVEAGERAVSGGHAG